MHQHRLSADQRALNRQLSRLFAQITDDPATPLNRQVESCGLDSIAAIAPCFEQRFGITLQAFHAVSLRAAEDRQFRRHHPGLGCLIINE